MATASGRQKDELILFSEFGRRWLAFLSLDGELADSTMARHQQVIRELSDIPGVVYPSDLTPDRLAAWVASKIKRGDRKQTIQGLIDSAARFCDYAVSSGRMRSNPVHSRGRWLPNNYEGRSLRIALSMLREEDVSALIDHLIVEAGTWHGRRLLVVVATGLGTGLGKSKLLTLEKAWFDLEACVFRARPGGRLERLQNWLVALLAEWFPHTGSPYVFPGVKRVGPWTGGMHLKRSEDVLKGARAGEVLKAAGQVVGIEGLGFESLREYSKDRWGAVDLGNLVARLPPLSLTTEPPTTPLPAHDPWDDWDPTLCPVQIRENGELVVFGRSKVSLRSKYVIRLVMGLAERYQVGGFDLPGLTKRFGTGARAAFSRLKKYDADCGAVFHPPGVKNGPLYRIGRPGD